MVYQVHRLHTRHLVRLRVSPAYIDIVVECIERSVRMFRTLSAKQSQLIWIQISDYYRKSIVYINYECTILPHYNLIAASNDISCVCYNTSDICTYKSGWSHPFDSTHCTPMQQIFPANKIFRSSTQPSESNWINLISTRIVMVQHHRYVLHVSTI